MGPQADIARHGNLILSMRAGETVRIGEAFITLVERRRESWRVAIEAPGDVEIERLGGGHDNPCKSDRRGN